MNQRITPCLWFDTEAEEAARFYVSLFDDARVVNVAHYPEGSPGQAGSVMTVEFELEGQRFTGLNGGPRFQFDEAISFQVACETQGEVDRLWDALVADGGRESRCGWLKDRFGLSWQIIPEGMNELFSSSQPERAQRAMQAMLGMKKLDLPAMRRAADGEPAAG